MPDNVYAADNMNNAYADDNLMDNAFQDSKSYLDKSIAKAKGSLQFAKSLSQ